MGPVPYRAVRQSRDPSQFWFSGTYGTLLRKLWNEVPIMAVRYRRDRSDESLLEYTQRPSDREIVWVVGKESNEGKN